ncbi:hypothetical protein Bca52824_075100 [Brassica carinata]|uniref:Uncharacterized protein n=1 Tax=Brassica carinata TaxID=52824 RepID=A0A8X7PPQ4_BRACI|nr:hypothetical protein Bca52824_075100 [Brassica carinata]
MGSTDPERDQRMNQPYDALALDGDIRLSLTSLSTSSICGFARLRKSSTGIPMRRSLSITTSSIKLWTTMGSRSTSGRRTGKSTSFVRLWYRVHV